MDFEQIVVQVFVVQLLRGLDASMARVQQFQYESNTEHESTALVVQEDENAGILTQAHRKVQEVILAGAAAVAAGVAVVGGGVLLAACLAEAIPSKACLKEDDDEVDDEPDEDDIFDGGILDFFKKKDDDEDSPDISGDSLDASPDHRYLRA